MKLRIKKYLDWVINMYIWPSFQYETFLDRQNDVATLEKLHTWNLKDFATVWNPSSEFTAQFCNWVSVFLDWLATPNALLTALSHICFLLKVSKVFF